MKKIIIAIILTLTFTTFSIHAVEQTAFKAAGIIESTSGGFKFPDGSVQLSAATTVNNRFEIRDHTGGVQTVFDNETGLEWEMQVICPGPIPQYPQCVQNTYSWSTNFDIDDADGSLFTDFLARLNNSVGSTSTDGIDLDSVCDGGFCIYIVGCYAGHCDWRIPDLIELKTILDCNNAPYCINPIFGPTSDFPYWTSTTRPDRSPTEAWVIDFANSGDVHAEAKEGVVPVTVRAVRGGR